MLHAIARSRFVRPCPNCEHCYERLHLLVDVSAAASTCFPVNLKCGVGSRVLRGDFCSYRLAISAVALAGLIAIAVNGAAAGEAAYCLSCTGPDRTYLCRVTGESAGQNDVFKLYCIVRTLRKGKHASCVATGTSQNCDGVVTTFKYHGPHLPVGLAENPKVKQFIRKVEEDYHATPEVSATSKQENVGPPPRRSMLRRMQQSAQRAGAALGGFAQASYRCLRSLFRRCSAAED
jgi:hypothetical protein